MPDKRDSMEPQKVLVVGLGVSGRAVCELLARRGVEVIGADARSRGELGPGWDDLEKMGCALHLGPHRMEDFLGADRIIVSPGVPLDIPQLREAAFRGIEILGELEWAWLQVNTPVVAITGTNGKTTTTALLGEIFRTWGKKTFTGGNLGTPLSAWLLTGAKDDLLVLEVSSFQLDTAHRFRPEVGVLLNITEDHLDRYENFHAYADSKLSLFARQNVSDVAIVNGDDPVCRERFGEVKGKLLTFSRRDPQADATLIGSKRIEVRSPDGRRFPLDLGRSSLTGVHNEENIMAAALAAASMGVPPAVIQEAVDRHKGYAHRLEWVRAWRGIDFYDDSKATNVGAVVKALENFEGRKIVLLLGGRDKLGSYRPLIAPLKEMGGKAFVFGEAASRICGELEKEVPVSRFPDMEKAFRTAAATAGEGDVVLLSPACSSFDCYGSYAERGDHFKRLAAALPGESE